jgi:hypothetical protein
LVVQPLGIVFTFSNLTLRPVVIEFRLLAYGRIYYDIVNPGENSTRFEWPMVYGKQDSA